MSQAAFVLQERNHTVDGKTFNVASTSYRAVNWEEHKEKAKEAGFLVEKMMDTENEEYLNV